MKNGKSEIMSDYKILISKNEVLDLIYKEWDNYKFCLAEARPLINKITNKIINLPYEYTRPEAHWDFVINETRVDEWEGALTTLYYNGYKCSNCGHGGGEAIPKSYGEMTEEEAKVFFGDMNYRFCPNCGAKMENGK